ncbi:MAG: hypothetical protein WCA58_14200 [Terriglobales bacterium]
MPTKSEHLARAEHNQRFAESFELKTTPYPDWVVVAYFYAAMHLVDALLWESDKINPPNHEERGKCVKDKWYLRGIKNEYRSLKDHSEDARYRLITFTSQKIENTVVPLYKTIKVHVQQILDNLSQYPRVVK